MKSKETGQVKEYENSHQFVATLPGSVAIHQNGEMDMRGVYCCLCVADILNVLEDNSELTRGMGDCIASC
jgi:prenyltransferase beta subunit